MAEEQKKQQELKSAEERKKQEELRLAEEQKNRQEQNLGGVKEAAAIKGNGRAEEETGRSAAG